MRAWIVGVTLFALQAPVSALTLGDFASALAVSTTASHSSNSWSALKPIKGVKWREATVKDAPSVFAQQADVALTGLGSASVLVVGTRQMMFDTKVSLRHLLEKKGLAQLLKAQFSAATLIEQIGGDCRMKTGSGSARLYRVTLPAKRPVFMWLEFAGVNNAGPSGTVFTLSIENKPQWAC